MYQRFFGKYVKNGELPPLQHLIHNVSLALVNSDRVFHGSRAFLPNVVEIGGVHVVKQNTKELPKELLHYFSIADDGIFLLTLGSKTKPSDILSKEKLAIMNHVFRSIPTAAVFARWDDRIMEHQSDNVVIGKWIPQTDMMGNYLRIVLSFSLRAVDSNFLRFSPSPSALIDHQRRTAQHLRGDLLQEAHHWNAAVRGSVPQFSVGGTARNRTHYQCGQYYYGLVYGDPDGRSNESDIPGEHQSNARVDV